MLALRQLAFRLLGFIGCLENRQYVLSIGAFCFTGVVQWHPHDWFRFAKPCRTLRSSPRKRGLRADHTDVSISGSPLLAEYIANVIDV